MTAEELEARLKELPVGGPPPRPTPTLVPPLASLADVVPTLQLVGGRAPPGLRPGPSTWNDPAIPAAYRCAPAALHGRAHPALRKATSGMPADTRYGALFLGPSGCGKSSVAAWAMRRWRSGQGRGLRGTLGWVDAIQMTDGDRRYRLGTGDPEELVHAYRCDWLVLDDVNLSCSATLVQLVLGRRYQAALPTIVTSGLRSAELVGHIGAAAVRRIAEFAGVTGLMVDLHEQERGAAP